MGRITEYPMTNTISPSDSIFVNKSGALKQISETDLEAVLNSDVLAELTSIRNDITTLTNRVFYKAGDVVTIPAAQGLFGGITWKNAAGQFNQIRLIIPLEKLISSVPTVEYEELKLNTYYTNGEKTINILPSNVSVIKVNGTNSLQVNIEYDEDVEIPSRDILARLNAGSVLRFLF